MTEREHTRRDRAERTGESGWEGKKGGTATDAVSSWYGADGPLVGGALGLRTVDVHAARNADWGEDEAVVGAGGAPQEHAPPPRAANALHGWREEHEVDRHHQCDQVVLQQKEERVQRLPAKAPGPSGGRVMVGS
jgi:hypothetical protein